MDESSVRIVNASDTVSPQAEGTAKAPDALVDQVQKLVPVLARYFASAVERGFTRDEALTLTVSFQSCILGHKVK